MCASLDFGTLSSPYKKCAGYFHVFKSVKVNKRVQDRAAATIELYKARNRVSFLPQSVGVGAQSG